MTYCIGIKTNEGLVFASDSRTNAGLDNVNIYSKNDDPMMLVTELL